MSLLQKDIDRYTDVRAWITEEIRFKSDRLAVRSTSHAQNERDAILHVRLPALWRGFQELREVREADIKNKQNTSKMALLVGQRALQSCMLAQTAFVMDQMAKGSELPGALRAGFYSMDDYVHELESSRRLLPHKEMLSRPLRISVNAYEEHPKAFEQPGSVLRTVIGLTLLDLRSQTTKEPLLPIPGFKTGEVVAWQQPRLQHP